MDSSRPERAARASSHLPPSWAPTLSTFFITINCKKRGKAQLTSGGTPETVFSSARYLLEGGQWYPEIILLMPDHLHALVSFPWEEGTGMSRVISKWKRYLARQAGICWQRDYFDHRLRNEEDHAEKWAYLRENPVRAGLVSEFSLWPHVWRPELGPGW